MARYNRENPYATLPQLEKEFENARKRIDKKLKELEDAITSSISGVSDVRVNGSSVVTGGVANVSVPMRTSELNNDSGFITMETDPTVPSWAKASAKPSYTFSEIGSKPTTLSGYGITDAKIQSGTITLGSNTITPLTSFTETDPTVPSWAKQSSKPSYTASEVGALPDTTPIPSKTSDLTNDSGFITGYTETDPTVPSWAKASSKPSYTASEVGALASADLYTRSSAGGLDWGTGTTGNMVIAKSALAFWNGTYNGSSSNLSQCAAGTIIGSSGGTMTGQLKTSFKSSVAMGSFGASSTTIPDLANELRFSSGCSGSVNITTAYTNGGKTIATGWYNFLYMPHRSGGVNGNASGDNTSYGNLLLFGMTVANAMYNIRINGGSIASLYKFTFT